MLSTHTGDYNIFIGQNAGDDIYHCIKSAKRTIKMVSPYVSPEYIDLLLDATARGVRVLLRTGSDMANNVEKRGEIYKKIITQQQHLDTDSQKRRKDWMLFSALLIVTSIVVGVVGYNTNHHKLLWSFATTPVFLFFFNSVKQIRIFNYTYDTRFDFGVFVSPYDQKIDDKHFFIHSKLYVIDEEVAFVGSVNFTKVAFRHNYECCVKLNDDLVVSGISNEIDHLTRTEGIFYRDISEIGRIIYPEPPN
ncbi:phospholipase D-like domain-containing protein [Thiovibrio frasassiensis]|uniref:Phospholipase D family protein n=1 Tax=Thiovibrio frasassiensis TaxID=2984131 RepID=A0A9X4RL17_9BACT|nr:phospholipase D-like domain-containing protein [Thiovibrio frasassiensis]MDG4475596.1 phospholipase D family protein [Thiovibrio frasassiensis]